MIKIPLSYVHLNVHSGTQKSKGSLESIEYPVKITNTACSGYATPNNAFGANIVHPNKTSTEGHLEVPVPALRQPPLCVLAERGGVKRAFTVSYDNTTTAGSTKSIFLGENSEAEKLAVRESEKSAFATRKTNEEAAITKRQSEEAALKSAREAEEAAKKTREATEKTEREKWKNEKKAARKNDQKT